MTVKNTLQIHHSKSVQLENDNTCTLRRRLDVKYVRIERSEKLMSRSLVSLCIYTCMCVGFSSSVCVGALVHATQVLSSVHGSRLETEINIDRFCCEATFRKI